jgi:hypothetical protein
MTIEIDLFDSILLLAKNPENDPFGVDLESRISILAPVSMIDDLVK